MTDDQLERVRRICLALPEAAEERSGNEYQFRVPEAMFAAFTRANGERPDVLWVAAGNDDARLVRTAPGKYFVPEYVGAMGWRTGWILIIVEALGDAELADRVAYSHRVVVEEEDANRHG